MWIVVRSLVIARCIRVVFDVVCRLRRWCRPERSPLLAGSGAPRIHAKSCETGWKGFFGSSVIGDVSGVSRAKRESCFNTPELVFRSLTVIFATRFGVGILVGFLIPFCDPLVTVLSESSDKTMTISIWKSIDKTYLYVALTILTPYLSSD